MDLPLRNRIAGRPSAGQQVRGYRRRVASKITLAHEPSLSSRQSARQSGRSIRWDPGDWFWGVGLLSVQSGAAPGKNLTF